MQEIKYDPSDQTVTVSPPVRSRQLNNELDKYGRMFPSGHHDSVGLGGFMMAGGFGWNCRQWGNGCEQILAMDMVTAEGELIHVDETHNSDYLWAVRGAGPGFFGVVTRFKLKTYAIPACMRRTVYAFGLDDLAELTKWMASVATKAPRCLESFLSAASCDENGAWAQTTISLVGFAFANSEAEAQEALALLETCPIRDHAKTKLVNRPFTLFQAYDNATAADKEGMRFATDNMYTNAEPEVIAGRIQQLFRTLPTPRSHIYWLNWGDDRPWPNMALSVQGKIYIAAYTLWDNEADDEAMEKWPVDQFRKLDDISVGGQMNDENIRDHPARYLSEAAEKRLEEMRAKYDPEGRFVSYLR
jgi:FAD/FMN-containing dehydrogenase